MATHLGGWRRAMIGDMGSAVGSDAVAGRVARPGAGGIVSRPRLFERLGTARVTVVSAPPGSGKTVLLRSWISQAGLAEHAAWVPAGRGERDPQQFWLSALVRSVTAAPELDVAARRGCVRLSAVGKKDCGSNSAAQSLVAGTG